MLKRDFRPLHANITKRDFRPLYANITKVKPSFNSNINYLFNLDNFYSFFLLIIASKSNYRTL